MAKGFLPQRPTNFEVLQPRSVFLNAPRPGGCPARAYTGAQIRADAG
jgi:hypothetical protein